MCGRYTVSKTQELLGQFFDRDVSDQIVLPVYNASPGQKLPVVLDANPDRVLAAHWGMQPGWNSPARRMLINARAETVDSRPRFAESFRRRRCLVLADGFYEWQASRKGKLPFLIRLKAGTPFAFAGIWETVDQAPAYVILTTEANRVTRPIHRRMPVILEPSEQEPWLDRTLAPGEALELLDPYPEDAMTAHRVSTAVNSSRNDGPRLIEPIEEPEPEDRSLFRGL